MAKETLKKKLSKLSQDKKKKKKVEEPVEDEEELEEDDEDLEDEDEDEDLDEEENDVVTTEPKDISKEEMEKIQAIENEITRLRDHGVYNAETLFQKIKINENLERIATALEKIVEKVCD